MLILMGILKKRLRLGANYTYPPGNLHIPLMFGIFEDDFPFPQVGYVNFLENNSDFGIILILYPERTFSCLYFGYKNLVESKSHQVR